MRRTPAQFARFLVAGLVNTAFGYVVFVALLWAGLGSLTALTLATVAGVVFNFQTSRALVFRGQVSRGQVSRGQVSRGQTGGFARFAAVYAVILVLNWAALSALETLGLRPWLGQALLTLPLALLSYGAQKLVVFGPRAEAA